MRLNELVHLRVSAIASARMVMHVRQGKGAKGRLVPSSRRLLEELRAYWRRGRPYPWLFPGHTPEGTLSRGNVQRRFRQLVQEVGLSKPCSMHTLRHSYATHLLEAGVDVPDAPSLDGALQPADYCPLSAHQHPTPAANAELARPAGLAPADQRWPGPPGGGPGMTAPPVVRPALEVAAVIRQYGDALLARYGSGLSAVQRQALR